MMEKLSLFAIGRLSAYAAIVSGLVVTQTGFGQVPSRGYEPPLYRDGETHYEKSEERFGRFIVKRYVEDCRDVPMLDFGCWLTKEARLEWHDGSGAIGFSFVDNGASVEFKAEGKSADGNTSCLMKGTLVGYDPKPSTVDNWHKLQPFIRRQLLACTAILPANLNLALKEAEDSGRDYEIAANAWKRLSVELFGSNARRCVATCIVKPLTVTPRYECVKYSKAQPSAS